MSAMRGGDGAPVDLLRLVELVAAGHAARVDVRDVAPCSSRIVRIRSPSMICMWYDVVEQLHPRRRHRLHDLDAERGVVALVVLVIDLAVQQLDADRDAVVLADLLDPVQAVDAVGDRFGVAACPGGCRRT